METHIAAMLRITAGKGVGICDVRICIDDLPRHWRKHGKSALVEKSFFGSVDSYIQRRHTPLESVAADVVSLGKGFNRFHILFPMTAHAPS